MKIFSLVIATCLIGTAFATSAAEPPKENERDQQQLAALTKEIQTQQTAIADNQGKIDAKLTAIAEALRLARIYASRSGK
jgi:vacuolar-type H+-ATPase subunit I/STV1